MPKADATGLAPEKSAYLNPRPFTGAGGSSLLAAVRRHAHFYGGASERRPWAIQRDDRPKGAPNSPASRWRAAWTGQKLRNSPGNSLRISGGKIVTRYRMGGSRCLSEGFRAIAPGSQSHRSRIKSIAATPPAALRRLEKRIKTSFIIRCKEKAKVALGWVAKAGIPVKPFRGSGTLKSFIGNYCQSC